MSYVQLQSPRLNSEKMDDLHSKECSIESDDGDGHEQNAAADDDFQFAVIPESSLDEEIVTLPPNKSVSSFSSHSDFVMASPSHSSLSSSSTSPSISMDHVHSIPSPSSSVVDVADIMPSIPLSIDNLHSKQHNSQNPSSSSSSFLPSFSSLPSSSSNSNLEKSNSHLSAHPPFHPIPSEANDHAANRQSISSAQMPQMDFNAPRKSSSAHFSPHPIAFPPIQSNSSNSNVNNNSSSNSSSLGAAGLLSLFQAPPPPPSSSQPPAAASSSSSLFSSSSSPASAASPQDVLSSIKATPVNAAASAATVAVAMSNNGAPGFLAAPAAASSNSHSPSMPGMPRNRSQITLGEITYGNVEKTPKVINQYVLGDVVGEGAFGKVREALDSQSLRRLAIKILKKRALKRIRGGEESIRNEISIMRKLKNHKNIVELVEVINDDEKQKMYIVLEFVGGGSLQELIDSAPNKRLPMAQVKSYFRQLIEGLEYIHSQGVVHRDIKPGNLMITPTGILKISDFGVAEELDKFQSTDICTRSLGSPAFQPPQIATGRDKFSGFKLDIWAAGVTLYLLATGEFPFKGSNIFHLFENIAKGQYTIPDWVDSSLASLIRGMLDPNESTRFSITDIKTHLWFVSEADDENVSAKAKRGLSILPFVARLMGHSASSSSAAHQASAFAAPATAAASLNPHHVAPAIPPSAIEPSHSRSSSSFSSKARGFFSFFSSDRDSSSSSSKPLHSALHSSSSTAALIPPHSHSHSASSSSSSSLPPLHHHHQSSFSSSSSAALPSSSSSSFSGAEEVSSSQPSRSNSILASADAAVVDDPSSSSSHSHRSSSFSSIASSSSSHAQSSQSASASADVGAASQQPQSKRSRRQPAGRSPFFLFPILSPCMSDHSSPRADSSSSRSSDRIGTANDIEKNREGGKSRRRISSAEADSSRRCPSCSIQ